MFRQFRLLRCVRFLARHEILVAVMLSLSVAGCTKKTLFPVHGKVVHKDGSPVTAGLVIFEPIGQKISARGEIHSDGTFQLGTHADKDGAMEGDYKVLLAPPPLPEEGKRLRNPISIKYQSLETTPLKFTVTSDGTKNKFDIRVD